MNILHAGLFQQLGERGNLMENDEYRRKKSDELQSRLADARSSIYHIELVITAILLNISGFVVERSLCNWQKVLICCHLPFYFVCIFQAD